MYGVPTDLSTNQHLVSIWGDAKHHGSSEDEAAGPPKGRPWCGDDTATEKGRIKNGFAT